MKKIILFIGMICFFLVSVAAEARGQNVDGNCNVQIAAISGNQNSVTVSCSELPSKVLRRLEVQLNLSRRGNQDAAKELKRLNDYLEAYRRDYKELQRRFDDFREYPIVVQKAKGFLEAGDLERAKQYLDQGIAVLEESDKQLAELYFRKAELLDLEFNQAEALSYAERAYGRQPRYLLYAIYYALLLQRQMQFSQARIVYEKVLASLRTEPQTGSKRDMASIAKVLNNLGIVFLETQRFQEAESVLTGCGKTPVPLLPCLR